MSAAEHEAIDARDALPTLPLTSDDCFDLLANDRRRAVIAVVGECDPERALTTSGLAYAATARLTGTPQQELTGRANG